MFVNDLLLDKLFFTLLGIMAGVILKPAITKIAEKRMTLAMSLGFFTLLIILMLGFEHFSSLFQIDIVSMGFIFFILTITTLILFFPKGEKIE